MSAAEEVSALSGADAETKTAIAAMIINLVNNRLHRFEFDEVEELCRKALKLQIDVVDELAGTKEQPVQKAALGRKWMTFARVLNRTASQDEVIDADLRGISLLEEVKQLQSGEPQGVTRGYLGEAYQQTALHYKQAEEYTSAQEYYLKAIDILHEKVADAPLVPGNRYALAEAYKGLSTVLPDADAIEYLRKAIAEYREAYRISPTDRRFRNGFRGALHLLARRLAADGRLEEVSEPLEEYFTFADRQADHVFGAYTYWQCALVADEIQEEDTLSRFFCEKAWEKLEDAKERGLIDASILTVPLYSESMSDPGFRGLILQVLEIDEEADATPDAN